MIAYEDVGASATWLCSAFGFTEAMRFTEDDGRVSFAQLEMGDGVVMLGNPSPHYQSPKHHSQNCGITRRWMDDVPYIGTGALVYVDDVDTHCEQARRAGATILSEPEDQPHGDRNYRVEDIEGHRWMFAQQLRAIAAEEWGAKTPED
jgi:PhnB protein